MAEPATTQARPSGGLTLAEMKAAAGQAGFDPALVERAANLLAANATGSPSVVESLFGGRARYRSEARYPVALDEADVTRLMSAIRLGVGRPGEGHASDLGLTWQSSDDGGAVLSLTAQTGRDGTSVKAELDRRGTLAIVACMTGVGSFLAVLFGGTVASELAPGFESAGALLGLGSMLAVARTYWRASTLHARERLSHVMDAVNQFLSQSGTEISGSEPPAPARIPDQAQDAGELL